MSNSHGLHQLYEKLLGASHSYGLPLYKPTSTRLMRPGSVGYFNALGDWAPVTKLDTIPADGERGLKPPEEELETARYVPITDWSRKYSQGVSEVTVSGSTAAE
jgi:hypothetical protein